MSVCLDVFLSANFFDHLWKTMATAHYPSLVGHSLHSNVFMQRFTWSIWDWKTSPVYPQFLLWLWLGAVDPWLNPCSHRLRSKQPTVRQKQSSEQARAFWLDMCTQSIMVITVHDFKQIFLDILCCQSIFPSLTGSTGLREAPNQFQKLVM